jgi:hypothetical protein
VGLRLESCSNVWIDQCYVHDVDGAGITANTKPTSHVYLTRNEVHGTANTGEGMYLGGNNGSANMSHSVIAQNYVHDTGGYQGDGIELKQGCYDNWIVDNLVHDTYYPCIIAYGTDGMPVNRIERNVVYNCWDNVMQVQGEAIVRNNLIMNGKHGFHSHDHQGLTRDLVFEHNTVINNGTAAYLASWYNRPGMVFANNVVYSGQEEAAIFNGGGAGGVVRAGNVHVGPVYGANPTLGFTPGNGLVDFEDVTWDGARRNALPSSTSALLGAADAAHAAALDLHRMTRVGSIESGAYQYGSWGQHYGTGLAGAGGVEPRVTVSSPSTLANPSFAMQLTGAPAFRPAILMLGGKALSVPVAGGYLLNSASFLSVQLTDAVGSAELDVAIPSTPTLSGASFFVQWAVVDGAAPQGVSQTDGLRLEIEP